MSFYTKLTMEQVAVTYQLWMLLRRLRVIGVVHAKTVQYTQEIEVLGIYDVSDITGADYSIQKLGYDPSKGMIDVEEKLEKIFGRKGQQLRGTP